MPQVIVRTSIFGFVSDGVHRCPVGPDFRGTEPPPPLASNRERPPCFGAHRIRPQVECCTALGFNHNHIVLASPLKDAPLNLLSLASAERQPGSPSGRGLAMFPAVSFLCLELFGERAVAYFSFTNLVRSFTVARAGLHSVFLLVSLRCNRAITLASFQFITTALLIVRKN